MAFLHCLTLAMPRPTPDELSEADGAYVKRRIDVSISSFMSCSSLDIDLGLYKSSGIYLVRGGKARVSLHCWPWDKGAVIAVSVLHSTSIGSCDGGHTFTVPVVQLICTNVCHDGMQLVCTLPGHWNVHSVDSWSKGIASHLVY